MSDLALARVSLWHLRVRDFVWMRYPFSKFQISALKKNGNELFWVIDDSGRRIHQASLVFFRELILFSLQFIIFSHIRTPADLPQRACNDGRIGPLWCWQYAVEHDESIIKDSSKDFYSESDYNRATQQWLQNQRNATKCSLQGQSMRSMLFYSPK